MTAILVGTSGWSYPTGKGRWNGAVYPRRWSGDELAYYAERFPAVEVNTTFYRLPPRDTVRQWIARTPQSFRFAVKLFMKYTHPEFYARHTGESPELTEGDLLGMRAVLDTLAGEGRLAALLVQYAESFTRTPAHVERLTRTLDRFRAYPLAVELRHPSWQVEDTRALLRDYHAAFTRIDEPFFSNLDEPSAPEASLQYWRFHGRNRAQWRARGAGELRYDYLYDDGEIADFVDAVTRHRSGARPNLLFFNNHVAGKAVANALMLAAGLKLPLDYAKWAHMTARYPQLAPITGGEPRLF
ncbi:MAG TPA: DUF72 domain-containing protein [Armatimonadota bacterium]|nr:DUF72 domain-containing protein [Armatimonadota bacterium]HOS42156.1 DUF72 domain-containing protein [Armatimonadota bacterium]